MVGFIQPFRTTCASCVMKTSRFVPPGPVKTAKDAVTLEARCRSDVRGRLATSTSMTCAVDLDDHLLGIPVGVEEAAALRALAPAPAGRG